jgi:hypothetical protein
VYFTGGHVVSAYKLSNGLLVTPPTQSAPFAAGGHPIMTANGTSNAVLWSGSGGILWAMDPMTFRVLWTTTMAALKRDVLPETAHFATPIIADGKLFIGAQRALVAYGLLPVLAAGEGDHQTAAVATALPVPLSIRAINPLTGQGAPGVTISLGDGNKGGTFSPSTAVTDSTGTVSTTYTLPSKSGTITVTASSIGYAPASFTETAAPTAAVILTRASGSGQAAPVATTLPKPLVAKAADQYGNGVPGISVTFSDGGKGGSLSANPVTTGSTGLAAVNYTTPTKSGKVVLTAAAAGLPTLNIFVTATPRPPSGISVVSGNNQAAAPSTTLAEALVAKVTDQYGNLIAGASVTFDDGGAGGSFSANPATTGTTGTASVNYTTPSNSGAVTVTATVAGVSVPATFLVTVR